MMQWKKQNKIKYKNHDSKQVDKERHVKAGISL